ncbi:hypothetical protein [Sulfobacillus thermosulfidooxidans]|uniref:hypothetical protein n=1 Tax=Sulfobacillus thermosulfidooxidans TaxID=28034 RepID=UPI0002EA8E19|nr:hypothetical protein [Sulfobacillus thermosulfidooxidans]
MPQVVAILWWSLVIGSMNRTLSALFVATRRAVLTQEPVPWVAEIGTALTTGFWRGWVWFDGVFLIGGGLLPSHAGQALPGVLAWGVHVGVQGLQALLDGPLSLWHQSVIPVTGAVWTVAGITQRALLWVHYDLALGLVAGGWMGLWGMIRRVEARLYSLGMGSRGREGACDRRVIPFRARPLSKEGD